MLWQDIVVSVSNIVFSISLVPQVIHGFRHKKGEVLYSTTIPTGIGTTAIAIAFFTLKLYASSALVFVTSLLWFSLALQRFMYNKKK